MAPRPHSWWIPARQCPCCETTPGRGAMPNVRVPSHCMKPWSNPRLVGVDGSPLPVLGCAQVEIDLAGEKLPMDVVVVSTLTTEAILGIDFLHKYRANIDLGEKKLSLGDRGCILPLVEANQPKQNANPCVRALETIQIPPWNSGEASTCSCGTSTCERKYESSSRSSPQPEGGTCPTVQGDGGGSPGVGRHTW